MSIITIILNICQGYFCPSSRVKICITVYCFVALWPPRLSCHQFCGYGGGIGLCASVLHLCVCLKSVCVFVSKVWSEWGFSSMIGAGLLSEAGLGLGDVDFDAVGAFRGGILPYWCRTLCCHQTFPGFLSLFVHSWVHTSVLPRWQLGLRLLLWHRWWKLLVFILRKSCQEGRQIKYGVALTENTTTSGADMLFANIYKVKVKKTFVRLFAYKN